MEVVRVPGSPETGAHSHHLQILECCSFPSTEASGPACLWIYPPNFRSSLQQMYLPSHLMAPHTWPTYTPNPLPGGQLRSLSLSSAHLCKQQELSLGYKQLCLLNCYLCLLTNSKALPCPGCNLSSGMPCEPCNPVPTCHSASRSWADSASRRGMGLFSEDVILFLLLYLESQRPLFISSQRVTFTLFICLFVLF